MWKRNSKILTSMLMILWYLTPCVFINLCLCKNCIGQGHGCAKPQRWGTRWIPGFTLPKTGFQAKIYNIDQDICRIQWKKSKPIGIRPKTLANNHGWPQLWMFFGLCITISLLSKTFKMIFPFGGTLKPTEIDGESPGVTGCHGQSRFLTDFTIKCIQI